MKQAYKGTREDNVPRPQGCEKPAGGLAASDHRTKSAGKVEQRVRQAVQPRRDGVEGTPRPTCHGGVAAADTFRRQGAGDGAGRRRGAARVALRGGVKAAHGGEAWEAHAAWVAARQRGPLATAAPQPRAAPSVL
eukprot:scaffold301640_cov33-Tisochrysis_lutea.AAC.1